MRAISSARAMMRSEQREADREILEIGRRQHHHRIGLAVEFERDRHLVGELTRGEHRLIRRHAHDAMLARNLVHRLFGALCCIRSLPLP